MTLVSGRHGYSVEATSLRSTPSISTAVRSDGRGSVDFGLSPRAADSANTGLELFGRGRTANGVRFDDIEEPRRVADLVERLRDV